jgi:hypothetical protein
MNLEHWLSWLTFGVTACAAAVGGLVVLFVVQANRIAWLDRRLRHQQHQLDAISAEQARASATRGLRRGRRRT